MTVLCDTPKQQQLTPFEYHTCAWYTGTSSRFNNNMATGNINRKFRIAHSNRDNGPRKTQKFGFLPKWRRKLLPVPVFTSFLNLASSNWSKTTYISIGCVEDFSRYFALVWNMQKLCKWVTCTPKRNFLWQFVGIVVPYHGDKNWAISLKTLGLRKIEVFVGLSF